MMDRQLQDLVTYVVRHPSQADKAPWVLWAAEGTVHRLRQGRRVVRTNLKFTLGDQRTFKGGRAVRRFVDARMASKLEPLDFTESVKKM